MSCVVGGAQVGRVPLAGERGHRCVARQHAAPQAVDATGVEQLGHVGGVGQLGGPERTHSAGGFDQPVRPVRIIGVGGQVEVLREGGGGQDQVALGVGRHGPEPVSPCLDGGGFHPVRHRRGEVLGAEESLGESQQAVAELAAVEGVPPSGGDRLQRPRRPGPSHALTGAQVGRNVGVPGHAGHVASRCGQVGRGGEPVGGEGVRRAEHLGKVHHPAPRMQGQPAVHAARDGDGSRVALAGHAAVTLGPEALG